MRIYIYIYHYIVYNYYIYIYIYIYIYLFVRPKPARALFRYRRPSCRCSSHFAASMSAWPFQKRRASGIPSPGVSSRTTHSSGRNLPRTRIDEEREKKRMYHTWVLQRLRVNVHVDSNSHLPTRVVSPHGSSMSSLSLLARGTSVWASKTSGRISSTPMCSQ